MATLNIPLGSLLTSELVLCARNAGQSSSQDIPSFMLKPKELGTGYHPTALASSSLEPGLLNVQIVKDPNGSITTTVSVVHTPTTQVQQNVTTYSGSMNN
ncbi:hypothetical protein VKT23_016630 [Stygiomarasmius scandens]|uniref:Uncharacterized protein n=1 Tax=Marasmiellus scandens TaxID=2682957 RepID=A0ABR1IUN2_9AGAR